MVILIGGGLLWHYLSKYAPQTENLADSRLPAETRVQEKVAEAPQEQPPPTVDPAGLAAEKKNAEQTLAEFLEAKGELDRKGVSEWGGQLYTDLTKLGQAADAFFMEKEYQRRF